MKSYLFSSIFQPLDELIAGEDGAAGVTTPSQSGRARYSKAGAVGRIKDCDGGYAGVGLEHPRQIQAASWTTDSS